MFTTIVWFILLLKQCSGKVTDEQYASMPDLFHQDDYDKCMLLGEKALYCSFTYALKPLIDGKQSESWKIIKEVISNNLNYRHDRLRHSICLKFSCPKVNLTETGTDIGDKISKCYNEKFRHIGLKGAIEDLRCETSKTKYPMDWIDICAGFITLSYVTMVLYASYYDFSMDSGRVHLQNGKLYHWRKIIAAFSIPRNWNRLRSTKGILENQHLRALQGVRFYNTIPVILSHTAYSMFLGPVANTKYTESMTKKLGNIFLSSGPLCVSTSFFMSSFLLTYGIFTQMANRPLQFKHLLYISFNRYLRLVPTLAFVLLLHVTWLRHFGNGPNWNSIIGEEYERCRSNGWTNLLFLNTNINANQMCMQHTWYLAQDSQYFVGLLLILWFIKRYQRLIWPTISVLLSVNVVTVFVQNYTQNFEPITVASPERLYGSQFTLNNPQWHYQLCSIVGNTAGPILGIALGYLYQQNQKIPYFVNEKFHRKYYYFLSFGPALVVTLAPGIVLFILKLNPGIIWASAYVAVSRPVFIMAVGYGVVAAMCGFGGLAKHVMEWLPASILGRLSYSAYLIHVSMVFMRPATARSPLYVSDWTILYNFMADFSMAYLLALVLTLFLEMPVSELQKFILPKKGSENLRVNGEEKRQ